MGRRITYVATFIPAALTLAFAVLWADVRAPLAALVLAIGAGGWSLAHRFSPNPIGAGELAAWASVVVGAAISIAILLPDTRILRDCPPPRGVAVFSCHCPVGRHLGLRVAISCVGAAIGSVLTVVARHRRSRVELRLG
jgi:hypothetical protein